MQFSELEYIALEGGGGKGAVYKGAIVALEKLFDQAWHEEELLRIKDGKLIRPPVVPELLEPANVLKSPGEESRGPTSILDYYERNSNRKIKGISGSSAGAITAFPLALGLSSDDIDKILKSYPFDEEFMPNNELHAGKYRMVGMDEAGKVKILVAQDSFRKLGASKIEQYHFSESAKARIGGNYLKGLLREFIVSETLRIILFGLTTRLEPLKRRVQQIIPLLKNLDFAVSRNYVAQLLSLLELWNEKQIAKISYALAFAGRSWIKSLLRSIGINPNRSKTLGFIPTNNFVLAAANVIWDRGIYSGFEVRDFFYRVLLLAISKDTHFRRGWTESEVTSGIASKADIEKLKIRFNSKFEVETDANDETSKRILKALRELPEKLTFKELHKIINLNLTVCVTNATSNQPLYFSHYFTPDFPVLEALGASMSFPVAFKPIYNEANVFLNQANASPSFVDFSDSRNHKNIYKETFAMSDYEAFLGVVLEYVKEKKGLHFSTNGNLSFRSFLPYLRRLIQENRFDEFHRQLCYFYYNSAFKGLLIDGGVTNNLPVSVFAFTTTTIEDEVQDLDVKKNVLALKLDNSFPREMKEAVRSILEDDKNGKGLLKQINESEGLLKEKVAQYALAASLFKKLKLKKAYAGNVDWIEMPKEVWVKIGKELIDEYKRTRGGFTPWNRGVNAISALFSSLQFGLDQGQIESIADNENIVALYCYGLSVFDFDLTHKEVKPLVEMAVKESEISVMECFGHK